MKKKTLLVCATAVLSTIALSSCGGKGGTSSSLSNGSSQGGGASSSTGATQVSLGTALQKDYSNATIEVTQVYEHGEMEGFSVEYIYNGYTIIYDELSALMGSDNPYLFYHDYQDKNYLFFEADSGNPNPVDAWLNKGYDDADLSLGNAYLDSGRIFKEIKASDAVYAGGMYIISDANVVSRLNETVFQFAYYNDIQYVAITVNQDGYLNKIIGLEEIDNDDDFVQIQFTNIGTTEFTGELPPEPNAENVMEYWQYKGYSGPIVHSYANSVTITADEHGTFDGETVVLEIEEELTVRSSFLPETADKHTLTWHSTNEDVVRIDSNFESGARTLFGVGAGEADIYCVAESEEGFDKGVKSNYIHVKVNPLKAQNKEGAIYDLTFTGLVDGTLGLSNSVDNKLPYSGKATKAAVLNGYSDLFEGNTLVLDPGSNGMGAATAEFDFDDQQVSSISLYYGSYYKLDSGIYYYDSNNVKKSWIDSIAIETSNDGTKWTVAKDITQEVLENISAENLKLLEASFEPASKVRISAHSQMTGKSFRFAFNEVAFMKNENCQEHDDGSKVKVESITVSAESTLKVGKTLTPQYLVAPNNATDKVVTWHSTDEEVAAFDGGVLKGLKAGKTKIYADCADGIRSNEVEITVEDIAPVEAKLTGVWTGEDDNSNEVKITVDDKSMTAVVGEDSFTLTYEDKVDNYYIFKDASSNEVKIKLEWGNDDHASVSAKLGSYTINKFGTHDGLNRLVVASSISVSATKTELNVGETTFAKVTFTPSNTTNKDVVWSSNNTDVATVADTGEITAVGAGTAKIKATSSNGLESEVEITVKAIQLVTSIEITGGKANIEIGEELALTAVVNPSDATNSNVKWSVDDSNVASISTKGVLKGKKAGKVVVTATATDGSGVKKSIEVNVTEPAGDIPASLQGDWTGYDDLSSTIVISISADGKVQFTSDDLGLDVTFTFDHKDGSTYVFVGENDYELEVYVGSGDTIKITLAGGEYVDDYATMMNDCEFERA